MAELARAEVVRIWRGEKEKSFDTMDYRRAISGKGPRAYDWNDKPHRLIYDLCAEIERLKGKRYDPDKNRLVKITK